jgi:hypothetical protein
LGNIVSVCSTGPVVHFKLHQERPIGPATGVTPTVPSHPQGWEMWFRRLDEATGRLSWASQKELFYDPT